MYFTLAGEGILDLAVAGKIVSESGHLVLAQYDKRGKSRLDQAIPGYARASIISPWLVLRDLDTDSCPLTVLGQIGINRVSFPNLILRICIRSIESWLIADRTGLAHFLGIRVGQVVDDPEALGDPKAELVRLARLSRRRDLREGLVPRVGSGRKIGPEYNALLRMYVADVWSVERAAKASDSLLRAVTRVREFAPSET